MKVEAEAAPARRFRTAEGTAVPAVTSAEMAQIDRVAIAETGPSLLQMMENAGRSLAELALACGVRLGGDEASSTVTPRIIVLAGSGGNGGGGICAARHLANRDVDVRLCLAEPTRLGPAAKQQLGIFYGTGGVEIPPKSLDDRGVDLIVDALIGYSLPGAPHGAPALLIRWANATEAPVLSLDIPSGIDATTGSTPGAHVHARWTMTLALPKTGLAPAAPHCGELWLADIGIPAETYRRVGISYRSPFGANWSVPLEVVPAP